MKNLTKYLTPPLLAIASLAVACSRAPIAGPAIAQSGAASAAPAGASALPLRALIVGGGPSPAQSQAGIEGNARYVSGLLSGARSTRVLWANGQRASASVAAVGSNRDKYLSQLAFAFTFSEEWPEEPVGFRAPSLPRLDGGVSRLGIEREVASLGRSLQSDEAALLYFTGHGSAGRNEKRRLNLKPRRGEPGDDEDDYENTVYWMWNDRPLSVRQLAPLLAPVPARNPLVLVMVQCHAAGFANLIFQDGNPDKPLLARDVCGFFAATADRMSAGCTPLVNEAESEDFTSHFFGALSGLGRGSRRVAEADFDGDGRASMLEAFAYASLHDRSIDVPTCTSQELLQHFFPAQESWYLTPFSRLEARASPWQKAILAGLSRELKLSGEDRLDKASRRAQNLARSQEEDDGPEWSDGLIESGKNLQRDLMRRFPGLKRESGSPGFKRAQREALKYLEARPQSWRELARGIESESARAETNEVREAMLWRFSDACLALIAEQKLEASGTPAQKAAFARLRASENRSLFGIS